jgi:hypothetical protein
VHVPAQKHPHCVASQPCVRCHWPSSPSWSIQHCQHIQPHPRSRQHDPRRVPAHPLLHVQDSEKNMSAISAASRCLRQGQMQHAHISRRQQRHRPQHMQPSRTAAERRKGSSFAPRDATKDGSVSGRSQRLGHRGRWVRRAVAIDGRTAAGALQMKTHLRVAPSHSADPDASCRRSHEVDAGREAGSGVPSGRGLPAYPRH